MSFTKMISLASESKMRVVDDVIQTLPVAVGQELKGPRSAIGGLEQPLTLRIFTDRFEQIVERTFHAREFGGAAARQCSNPTFRCLEFRLVILHKAT